MNGLNRITGARYINDREQAQRSTKAKLDLMLNNSFVFRSIKSRGMGKSGAELLRVIEELHRQPIEALTNKQLSYIDDIYDKFSNAYVKIREENG
jgi:predicted acetyltransferase